MREMKREIRWLFCLSVIGAAGCVSQLPPADARCLGSNSTTPQNRYICLGQGRACRGTTLPCCTDECVNNDEVIHNPNRLPELFLVCGKTSGKCGGPNDDAPDAGTGGIDAGPCDPCNAFGSWRIDY